MKKALIFGITGQDGSYLAELLLSKGYEVHGVVRRSSVNNRVRLQGFIQKLKLHEGDLADTGSIWRIISAVDPDEIYNLAAQTHVHTSFAEPEHTGSINALGPVRIMEAVRHINPEIKIYQASTSELFGQGTTGGAPLDETSPMMPVSPYGAAKLYAFTMARMYRSAYGLFVCNGILFNHESPRRGGDFVTLKIANFAKSLSAGDWNGEPLRLGNLEARRDWGHARDYVEGMWRMLQQPKADDFVLATGTAHSVREFAERTFSKINLPLNWHASGASDGEGRSIIAVDTALLRPVDVPCLLGNSAYAQKQLGWLPRATLDDLVSEMLAA